MAKNRKNQAAEIRFGPVLKVLLLCSMICGSALGYVWQKNQIDRLGMEIQKKESTLRQMKQKNEEQAKDVNFLRSREHLVKRVTELNLGLVPVQPQQVIPLREVPFATDTNSVRQFASGR